MNQQKKWWQSTNFYISAVLVIGSLFIGFPEETAQSAVYGIAGILAAAGIIRNWAKDARFDFSQIQSANFWNYIATLAAVISPIALPENLFQEAQEVTRALFEQNWQSVLISGFSMLSILFNIITGRRKGE